MNGYFDYAATTPVRPEAVQAALEVMTGCFGNPSSGYDLGRQAAQRLKADRADVAAALGCASEEVVFTSCGTEGNNWAIRAALWAGRRRGRHVVTTAVEHAAVLETMKALETEGYRVTYLKPDVDGRVSVRQVRDALTDETVLVSMMLVNNETGVLLPVAECAREVKAYHKEILVHCDAVQGFLKVPFTPERLGVDLLTVSGHKIGAPKGVGALYVKQGLKLRPLLFGGGQESGLRPGTEATAQIAAFAAACRAGFATAEQDRVQTAQIKAYALEHLCVQIPDLIVVSPGDAPHICAVSLPGFPGEMLVRALDEKGFCVSSGSACKKGKPSHVYAAMGLVPKTAIGVLRVSFAPDISLAQVDALAAALTQITSERVSAVR